MRHPSYTDTYLPDSDRLMRPGRHGPYWLDKIELQHFVLSNHRDVRDRLTH